MDDPLEERRQSLRRRCSIGRAWTDRFCIAPLEVQVPFSDSPPCACGRSAWPPRTVRPFGADGPPRPLQIA
jgi:hypothetical protein